MLQISFPLLNIPQTGKRLLQNRKKYRYGIFACLVLGLVLVFSQQLAAFSQTSADNREKLGLLYWPTGHPTPVVRAFKAPKAKWLPGHRGVELQYRESAPVYAAAAGRVYYCGVINHIPVISILHRNGIRSTYLPVRSELKKGETVTRSQIIGKLVSPDKDGRLKFGLKLNDSFYLNPMPYLYGPIILRESDVPSRK